MTTPLPFGSSESLPTLDLRGLSGHVTLEADGTLTAGTPTAGTLTAPGPARAVVLGGDELMSLAPATSLHAQPASPSGGASGGTLSQTQLFAAPPATHITIVPTFDASVTNAASITTSYESAVNSAIQYFENEITTPITVDITFGWGEVGGSTISAGALGESSSSYYSYSYTQVYNAVQGLANKSAVQQAAYATLPATDPTSGASIDVNTAQAMALGLSSPPGNPDGSVGLDSTSSFFWSQGSPQANSYDAVSTFEHEISEVLGRLDNGGAGNSYTLLDFFRYTAADLGTADAPGSAAGSLDQPFVPGYSASNQSYFSYNGKTVAYAYDTPPDVAQGNDIADWGPNVANDSFGFGVTGAVSPVSTVDLQELNVIGYSLTAACYAAGTRIATALGEAPIEALRVGDLVRLAGGGTAPVVWLGHRQVDAARHPRPETMWPVRVRAGAFGGRIPARDLLLSPDHSVLADGVLVPIRCLINGATIVQEARQRITYWHVELPRHAAILAEGLAAESYLDTGNRAAFDNAGTVVAAHPDFGAGAEAAWRAGACAPQVTHGEALERVRRRLLARTAALGWRRAEARPVLRAAGRTLRGQVVDGELCFVLPPDAREAMLASESSVPRDAGESHDTRRLGIAVAAMALDGIPVALDDARLGDGWHTAEAGWRWTDGAGMIPVAGARLLSLRLATAARCWVAPEGSRRATG